MARSSRSAASRSPFRNISGCSAARLARQLRELEVPSSNLGIPTTFPEKPLRNQWFFISPPLPDILRSHPAVRLPLSPQKLLEHSGPATGSIARTCNKKQPARACRAGCPLLMTTG